MLLPREYLTTTTPPPTTRVWCWSNYYVTSTYFTDTERLQHKVYMYSCYWSVNTCTKQQCVTGPLCAYDIHFHAKHLSMRRDLPWKVKLLIRLSKFIVYSIYDWRRLSGHICWVCMKVLSRLIF